MSEMRIAKRFLLLLLLCLSLFPLFSCRALVREVFTPPKVKVVDAVLGLSPLTDPTAKWEIILSLAVDNPNGYPLNIAYVAYSAAVGTETVAEGEHRDDIRIAESGVTVVKVPLTILPERLFESVKQSIGKRKISYEFNGSVGLRAPVAGVVRIPFSKTGEIDPLDILRKKGFGVN